MLSGLIVYSKADRDKNVWFIEKCIESLSSKGLVLIYKDEEDALDFIENNRIDFVIYRSRNYQALEKMQALGIRCFNSPLTNKIANDKFKTFEFLNEQRISCVSSFLSNDKLSLPFIMKSISGHGGQEVYLISDLKDIGLYKEPNKKYIYQNYLENSGDLRVYVLGKKVVGAVLRSNKNDFRSNFSLGGDIKAYEPEQEIVDTAIKIAELLDADYIGVDFLKVGDNWLVNEIEDPVGARMLFKASGIDAASLFADYVYNTLIKKS